MQRLIYLSLALTLFACSKTKNTAHKEVTTTTVTASTSGSTPNTPSENATVQVEPQKTTETEAEKAKDEIKWLTYDEAVKQAKKKQKKIFIDVYTDWCGWCKKMDKSTFKDSKIAAYMNKKYYAVKLDAESEKAVTFQGKQMTEAQLASRVFKISGYPSTVYLEHDEKIIQPIPGYMDVATMDKILHYVGEDYYKTQTWEEFQMSYKE